MHPAHGETAVEADSLRGDLLRIAGAVFLVAIAALWITHYANLGRMMYAGLQMNDFGKFYYSAGAFLAGADMYGATPATSIPVEDGDKQFWNLNPPHFHFLILPLALLTPWWALSAWALLNIAGLAVSVGAISRELEIRWTYWRGLWLLFGLVVCSATGAIVFTGQFTFLLMVPVTLAWVAARRGRWSHAAVWAGVAASVKPFLGVLGLIFLVKKEFRPAAVMGGTIAAAFAAGLLVFGSDAHIAWLARLRDVDWAWASMNGSIAGLLSRAFSDNPLYASVLDAPSVVRAGFLVSACAVGGVTAWSLWRTPADQGVDYGFAGLLLAGQLISPLGWIYYLWILLGPMWALLRVWERDAAGPRVWALALAVPGLICPVSLVLFWRHEPWATPMIGSIYTWSTLLLWGAVVISATSGPSLRSQA
jgi:hypothetical protein